MQMEGIVSKNVAAPNRSGHNDDGHHGEFHGCAPDRVSYANPW
jgi:hypothetical protein